MTGTSLAMAPTAASADASIVDPSDIGKYTDGQTDSLDIGNPTYTHVDEVAAALQPGVPYTAGSMYQSIFEQDLANGGTDYYLDRVLGVKGAIGPTILQTRGRSLYMRGTSTASFTTMGFAGTAYAGGPNNLGNFYTVTVPGQTVSEVSANRFNAPSHLSDTYTIGSTGVTADENKFITYDNVAVTTLTFHNPGTSDVSFTVRAASPLATTAGAADDELYGTRVLTSGSNNGLIDTPWSTAKIGVKAAGFTRSGANLDRAVTVPAGGSVDLSVVGVLYSDSLPDSLASFYDYAGKAPAEAFRDGVTDFNRRWASDIPYIDVPDPAIEKAIVYRWWGERYNSLDANEPGYVYQYPTTIEGVNLYQNAVVLTQPMHLQDTKWIRNPYLAYGQILNVGELSGSSAFLDSPGHTSWNNHYSQYIGTAGLEAYQVQGGGPEVAERFAQYFEGDGVGQLEHYDGDGDNLIQYDSYYMPGNDADAVSFGFPKSSASAPGARTIERPESAYVWGDFNSAAQLYAIAGESPAKVAAMTDKADDIRDSILENLWSPTMRMFLAGTSYGATSAATASTGKANPLPAGERDLIPARESNLYDVYAENLIPAADADQYVDGLRFLRYGDNFPIFPFYTADQYDRSTYGIGGSNNFSNINFTVEYRGIRSALRYYDPDGKWITPQYAEKLLQWMAWSVYPSGDLRTPNQGEYYSNWNASTQSFTRNNPYHVMLGNMNYIYIEDMGGLQPRSDDLIQLWPIDLGYDHFMVNNLRYHDHDLTIVWDRDGSHYGLGAGYSLFVDGDKKVTTDELGQLTYDPNANTVQAADGLDVTFVAGQGTSFPTAVDTPIRDQRVVGYLKTAGIDLASDAPNLAQSATLSSSYTQQGTRPTPWREFHTPGFSTSSMNYTPGAIKTTERPVSLAAVTDGQTVNEPYWGNYGTTDPNGYVELDFATPQTFDNVKVYFVSDRQAGGYHEPAKYTVQVPDGSGGWTTVPDVYKSPKVPGPKANDALFHAVTADKVRVAFVNSPTYFTAISEIQVFDSGREVPVVVNDPPTVTAAVDATKAGNLSTGLVATATDDGIPDGGTLAYGWDVVSKPDGAGVIFSAPNALTTTVTGTVEGDYVFRFHASDGALTTEKTVAVTLVKKAVVAEFGAQAAISSSGVASWEDQTKVNQPTTPSSSNPGTGNGWGSWGQTQNGTSVATAAWLRYTWSSPISITSTDVYWYDDNGGTRVPTATTYAVEYSNDGTTWTPVTLTGGSSYAGGLVKNQYNHFDFAPIKASQLRIRIWGVQGSGAGTGVLRWRVNGDTVSSVASPVVIRTVTGVVPTLPASLDIVYSGGERDTAAFQWQEITPDMVAEDNVDPFVVYGTNSVYGLIAEAQVYVRPESSSGGIAIQGAEQFAQSVAVGEQPYLPTKVLVSYNDGSRDNQAVGVEWRYDPSVVDTAGVYQIVGDLVLPDYVSSSGTTQTTLTLTVGTPAVTAVTVDPAQTSVRLGESQRFTAQVSGDPGTEGVTWSLAGASSPGTTIDGDGLLTVDRHETAASLTVTAASTFDPTKSASAAVTLVAPTVTAVTVSPQSVSVPLGESQRFTVQVSGDPGTEGIGWSLAGATSSGTTLSSDGLLTVASDEAATSLTVTATSTYDPTKSASAVVTLVPPLWQPGAVYTTGDRVTYGGATFRALWWTSGERPGSNVYGAWEQIATDADGTAIWTASRVFVAGDVVVYRGAKYTAQWWTRNQAPGDPYGPWKLVLDPASPAAWTATTVYFAGDLVTYRGVVYAAQWYNAAQPPMPGQGWGPWKAVG
jgi:chitodextrinase